MENNMISKKFDKFDKIAEKFDNSALIYIAARPGMGLKTFANNLAEVICRTKESCWIFNYKDVEELENELDIFLSSEIHAQTDNSPIIRTINMPEYEDKPKLSDLQNTDIILRDADVIMFLHRDNFTADNGSNPNPDITELIIAENLYGDTGTINIKYDSNEKCFFEADD